ncbi:MAG: hypothetical protein DMF81_03355 [Acidobacteria bacterium]|nr:MAG: hypothetical protein DMF81_03355 [Acidobacteriota bacterium]
MGSQRPWAQGVGVGTGVGVGAGTGVGVAVGKGLGRIALVGVPPPQAVAKTIADAVGISPARLLRLSSTPASSLRRRRAAARKRGS